MSGDIRRATAADTSAVEQTVHAAYLPWVEIIGMRPLPMEADYVSLIEAGRIWVLVGGEHGPMDPAQALIVLVPEDDALLVENVAVHPSAQGQGIGRRLMAFAEDQARSLGLPALRLYTNEKMTSNIALYEFLGYRRTGQESIDRRPAVHFRKDLPRPS